jgi:hypothetical protein
VKKLKGHLAITNRDHAKALFMPASFYIADGVEKKKSDAESKAHPCRQRLMLQLQKLNIKGGGNLFQVSIGSRTTLQLVPTYPRLQATNSLGQDPHRNIEEIPHYNF